ncbi:MAG: penicillin-binding protein 2 [Acidobacteriia bacterium]|nr:penicillin-binding protein 2 [Terriglobia bacterium]
MPRSRQRILSGQLTRAGWGQAPAVLKRMEFRFPEDERLATWKIAFLQYVIAATFLVLLIGYWRLQIGQHRQYLEQAERNRIRNLPVIAPRGRILDREGRVLADNFPAFSVLLMRESPAALTPPRVQSIARGLQLDPADLQRLVERTAKLPRFQPVVLKQSAPMEDIAFVESHRVEYPELDLLQVQQRSYPKRAIAAAVLGYVGEVSEEMIATPSSPYRPGDVVGKSGLERSYNSVLAGRDGMRRVIVNSRGQEMGSMTTINATPGNDLRLTLDLDLQMAAEAGLGEQPGAVVALNPGTGEILAMVSHPAFDPNDFARRIDREAWDRLNSDPQKPLMNKAIQAHLAPGSVFKIITGTAALETGTIKPDFTVSCPGVVTIYGHTYHDWVWEKGKGHGSVDFHRAIVVSCDVYFYTLGKLLGIEKIAYFAKRLGLGSRTGVDLPAEDPGLIPSPEWVRRAFKRQWWAGETISVAIGQGAVAVTPLQLAYAIGGIASGGLFRRPHLVFKDQLLALGVEPERETDREFPLREETVDAVSRGMWGAVNEGGGTGARAHDPGLDIAGKTGTAQVVSDELQKSARKAEYRNNAWFVGYAPSAKPEIVVSVLVMQGEHSTVAVPIARDVIKAYFQKKAWRRPPAGQLQTQVREMSQVLGTTPSEAGPAPQDR